MKIINIILSKDKTGLERTHFDYTQYLKILGHDAEVVIARGGRFRKEFQKLDVPVHRVKNKLGTLDFLATLQIRKIIKETKADLVIAHNTNAITLGKLASAGLCPVIGVNYKQIVKQSFNCHSVVTINSDMKKRIISKGVNSDKIYVIPNSIEIPEKLPVKKRISKTITVGTVGKLSLNKGFIYLIEALDILKDKYDNIHLIIAGDGPDANDIKTAIDKKLLHSKIEFLGYVNDKDELFNRIDIFCLPAIKEAFGIVLLEAALYKKPIITTDSAGPSDILTHQENAYLVKIGKSLKNFPRRLERAVEKLYEDKDFRDKISKNAHNHVIKNYSHEAVAKNLETVIKDTIERYKK